MLLSRLLFAALAVVPGVVAFVTSHRSKARYGRSHQSLDPERRERESRSADARMAVFTAVISVMAATVAALATVIWSMDR